MSSGMEAYFSNASLPLPMSADAERVRQKSASFVMALPSSGFVNAGRPRFFAVGSGLPRLVFSSGDCMNCQSLNHTVRPPGLMRFSM